MHITNFCTIVSYQLILIIASIDRWGAINGDLPSTLNLTSMVAKTTTKSASVATKVTDNATRALLHCPLPSLSNPKPCSTRGTHAMVLVKAAAWMPTTSTNYTTIVHDLKLIWSKGVRNHGENVIIACEKQMLLTTILAVKAKLKPTLVDCCLFLNRLENSMPKHTYTLTSSPPPRLRQEWVPSLVLRPWAMRW